MKILTTFFALAIFSTGSALACDGMNKDTNTTSSAPTTSQPKKSDKKEQKKDPQKDATRS